MSRHKLKPYTLNLREKGQTTNYSELTNILLTDAFEDVYAEDLTNAPQDLIDLFDEYAEEWRTDNGAHIDSDYQKTLRVSQEQGEYAVDQQENVVEAIFKYGDYGQTVDSYDTETGDSDTEVLEASESAEIPLYLLLHVPEENPEEALIVMQESSNRGMKMRFQDALHDKLPERVANEMGLIKNEEVFDTIRYADKVTKVTVETSESPDELGGEFNRVFSPSQTAKKVEYRSTNNSGIRLDVDQLESWIENDDNPFRDVGGNTYTEAKVTVKRAGSETTIDLIDRGNPLTRTLDDVDTEGGHPVPSYMGEEARRFVNQELLPAGADAINGSSMLR